MDCQWLRMDDVIDRLAGVQWFIHRPVKGVLSLNISKVRKNVFDHRGIIASDGFWKRGRRICRDWSECCRWTGRCKDFERDASNYFPSIICDFDCDRIYPRGIG